MASSAEIIFGLSSSSASRPTAKDIAEDPARNLARRSDTRPTHRRVFGRNDHRSFSANPRENPSASGWDTQTLCIERRKIGTFVSLPKSPASVLPLRGGDLLGVVRVKDDGQDPRLGLARILRHPVQAAG